MKRILLALVALIAANGSAFADLVVKDGAAATQTIFDFTCFTTKHCPVHVNTNSAGTEVFTATSPAFVGNSLVTSTLSGWTSATALNATQTLLSANGAPAILVQLNQTTTLSAGAVTFEGTYDGTNWVTIPVGQVINPNTFASLTNPYTLEVSTNRPFLILTQGYQQVRIKLTTAITGTATVTPFVTLMNYNPTIGALLNPISAGTAVIGKVGIDQTTPGTTNAVRAIAGTNGGASTTGNIAANNTTAVVVKASAGTLFGAQLYGLGSAPAYLKIYNAATATCGAGTPVKRLMIPAASTAANGAGSNIQFGAAGINFGTGITYCVTTGITDADATAPAASTFLVNLDWL